jgi:hypothetical protein
LKWWINLGGSGSSQKVGDKHLILDKWKRKHQNFRNISQ